MIKKSHFHYCSLECVLHQQPRHDSHCSGEGSRADALAFQRLLVNVGSNDKGRGTGEAGSLTWKETVI